MINKSYLKLCIICWNSWTFQLFIKIKYLLKIDCQRFITWLGIFRHCWFLCYRWYLNWLILCLLLSNKHTWLTKLKVYINIRFTSKLFILKWPEMNHFTKAYWTFCLWIAHMGHIIILLTTFVRVRVKSYNVLNWLYPFLMIIESFSLSLPYQRKVICTFIIYIKVFYQLLVFKKDVPQTKILDCLCSGEKTAILWNLWWLNKIEVQKNKMRTSTYRLICLCTVANFINSADRAILPIAIIQMADEFGWSLSWQGWILSSFSYGYITSQVSTLVIRCLFMFHILFYL